MDRHKYPKLMHGLAYYLNTYRAYMTFFDQFSLIRSYDLYFTFIQKIRILGLVLFVISNGFIIRSHRPRFFPTKEVPIFEFQLRLWGICPDLGPGSGMRYDSHTFGQHWYYLKVGLISRRFCWKNFAPLRTPTNPQPTGSPMGIPLGWGYLTHKWIRVCPWDFWLI